MSNNSYNYNNIDFDFDDNFPNNVPIYNDYDEVIGYRYDNETFYIDGLTETDYKYRIDELYDMILHLNNITDKDINYAKQILNFSGDLWVIFRFVIHPSLLDFYNKLSNNHLHF